MWRWIDIDLVPFEPRHKLDPDLFCCTNCQNTFSVIFVRIPRQARLLHLVTILSCAVANNNAVFWQSCPVVEPQNTLPLPPATLHSRANRKFLKTFIRDLGGGEGGGGEREKGALLSLILRPWLSKSCQSMNCHMIPGFRVDTHKGTIPCDLSLQLVPWRVYTKGLVACRDLHVPPTVHAKRLEEHLPATCPKSSNQFEFVGTKF